VGLQNRSGRRGEEKILPLPGLELGPLGRPARSQSPTLHIHRTELTQIRPEYHSLYGPRTSLTRTETNRTNVPRRTGLQLLPHSVSTTRALPPAKATQDDPKVKTEEVKLFLCLIR
jgi:hypothetical protein